MNNFHRHLCAITILFVSCLLVTVSAADAWAQQDQANVIPPITEQASNVTFFGNGAVTLSPFTAPGAIQATPAPECANSRPSQLSFRVSCTSDPKQKSTDSCRGSLSLFALNLTQNVSGEVSGAPGGPYTMTLHSPDMSITSCTLTNQGKPSPDTGNTVLMQSCTVNFQGCIWSATGAGGDHALTESATVTVEPQL